MIAISHDPGEVNAGYMIFYFDEDTICPIEAIPVERPMELKGCSFITTVEWHLKYFRSLVDYYKTCVITKGVDLFCLEGPALSRNNMFNIGALHGCFIQHAIEQKINFIHMPISKWKYANFGTAKDIKPPIVVKKAQKLFIDKETAFSKNEHVCSATLLGYSSIRFFMLVRGMIKFESLSENEKIVFGGKGKIKGLCGARNVFWRIV